MGLPIKTDKDKREDPAEPSTSAGLQEGKPTVHLRQYTVTKTSQVPAEPSTLPAWLKRDPPVFMKRNLQNRTTEPKAPEELFDISDGLLSGVCKCNNPYGAYNMKYIFGAEDFLHWKGGKAKSSSVTDGHLPEEASEKETLRSRRCNRLFRSL